METLPDTSALSEELDANAEFDALQEPMLSLSKESNGSMDAAYDEIRSLLKLSEDWDGIGAVAPDINVINTAFSLLRHIERSEALVPQAIVASPLGYVVFSWQLGGTYIEAEIKSQDLISWLLVLPDKQSFLLNASPPVQPELEAEDEAEIDLDVFIMDPNFLHSPLIQVRL